MEWMGKWITGPAQEDDDEEDYEEPTGATADGVGTSRNAPDGCVEDWTGDDDDLQVLEVLPTTTGSPRDIIKEGGWS